MALSVAVGKTDGRLGLLVGTGKGISITLDDVVGRRVCRLLDSGTSETVPLVDGDADGITEAPDVETAAPDVVSDAGI